MKFKIHTQCLKLLADLHTPVSIYSKLRDIYPGSLLFESADYHDRTDNKSFICIDPIAHFEAKGNIYQHQLPFEEIVYKETKMPQEIIRALESFVGMFDIPENEPPLKTQGLWGYSSFESVEYMEDITLSTLRDNLKNNPDLKYQLFRFTIILDHFKKEMIIVEHSINTLPKNKTDIKKIIDIIQSNNYSNFDFQVNGDEISTITDEEFKKIVATGINHCLLGDTFQVVLSREFRQSFKGDDFTLYRHLRSVSPSPYLFYLDYLDFKIFGSSPESQLQVHNGVASINPIAGTIRRGNDPEEDRRKADELRNNPKEMSEHVMLVDLARNDLSKNASEIEVETYADIQYFAQVIHMVSKVRGKLLKNRNGIDVYADTFPAGTLSGAPKYRAMKIIAKNEKDTRNFYGGAVGFLGFDGSVNHAIIIRSILSKNNMLIYQAGAGIVAGSHPEGELNEVNNKLRAIRKAIKKASQK